MAEGNPLHDARALLRGFAHSKLRALDVRSEGLALFLSRDEAIRYRGRQAAAPAAQEDHGPATDLSAPHLGTLTGLAPVGTRVAAGDIVARLMVLNRETTLVAQADGMIVAHHHAEGALVEFGQPLVAIT
ncbi:MAG: biotin/lipoyl-containing protein [Pseudomonadota bacterium]